MKRQRALDAVSGRFPDRIPHWEQIYSPEYIKMVTGIDPLENSREAVIAMIRGHPIDVAVMHYEEVPLSSSVAADTIRIGENEYTLPRWNTGTTERWDWGSGFDSIEDVLAYDPLNEINFIGKHFIADYDFSLPAGELARSFQSELDQQREDFGDTALELAGFYNTLFMWPLLTFGWENLLLLCGGYPKEMKRLLKGFAERSRRAFEAIALTDTRLVWSHDDICCSRGPVVSPAWLRDFLYPYYEEFWSIAHKGGKRVLFISDGDVTAIADDVFSLGADGILSEPYTDWKKLAWKHPDKMLIGQGDNRVLLGSNPSAIKSMVREMVETARDCPGYFMHVGNSITHTTPIDAIKAYFEASEQMGYKNH